MSEVVPQTTEPLSTDEVVCTIVCIARQTIEKTTLDSPSAGRVVLLGIPSGGIPLAEKLADLIEQLSGIRSETGSLDITLYRDDLHRDPYRALQPMSIPNSGIDGTTIVLVGDVLFSGRTIHAALDAIASVGRPRVIQLAVLVDRGHRQLPIRADHVGRNLPTSRDEDVNVLVEVLGGRDAAIPTRAEGQRST